MINVLYDHRAVVKLQVKVFYVSSIQVAVRLSRNSATHVMFQLFCLLNIPWGMEANTVKLGNKELFGHPKIVP